jgi:hypothetical protein
VNDLIDVRDALGEPEPPSHAAVTAARAALLQRAAAAWVPDRRVARRRAGRLAGGIGLTAAAITAVAAVTTALVTSGGPGGESRATGGRSYHQAPAVAVARLSARRILLAAATTAAAAPESPGRYWYLEETGPGPAAKTTQRQWYTHDGSDYTWLVQDQGVFLASRDNGFQVGASSLTYRQVEQLPAGAAALTAWITRSFHHPSGPPLPRGLPSARYTPPSRAELPGDVALALSNLIYQVPAPPAVRAAAFRALAAMPNVTKLGHSGRDVVLRISVPPPPANKFRSGKLPAGAGQIRLTIDTTALTLRAVSDYQGTTTVLAARWTNTRPRLIPNSELVHAKQAGG